MDPNQLAESCIHCGRCTRCCAFLDKYHIDLQGLAARPELAWSCFLCGDCLRVCPKDIDGREISLCQRRQAMASGGRPPRGCGLMLVEKRRYLFRSYRRGSTPCVLFPGCSFPSFFPKTTRRLARLLWETAGIGTVFDCCGKPVSELGLARDEARILHTLARRLHARGVRELVTVCPNCYHFLRPRLDIPVVSIYEKLTQLGLGQPVDCPELTMFLPCPDKGGRELLTQLSPFVTGRITPVSGVQCCGLGGCASCREPELAHSFRQRTAEQAGAGVYTYCASCAGILKRDGCPNVRHILPAILGMEESPAGASLLHRASFRLYGLGPGR